MEVIWKLIEAIIATRVDKVVQFHDCLHAFRHLRGTDTAILEAKLVQELACNDQEPLFYIFLDLRKAYDTIDRSPALAIREGYGVGPNSIRLFRQFWEQQHIVARQSGYHGPAFNAKRGQTQGGVFSCIGFNIYMDAAVRHWLTLQVDDHGHTATHGMGQSIAQRLTLLYADDSLLGARNST
jgi:Reverse transcriptase (RNA-dependent DNA polymerase)